MSRIVRAERVGQTLEFELCPLERCLEDSHPHQVVRFGPPPATRTGFSEEELAAMSPEQRDALPEAFRSPGEPWAEGEYEAKCAEEARSLHAPAPAPARERLDQLIG